MSLLHHRNEVAFFEASCPNCSALHAVFTDDPNEFKCACGAELIVDRASALLSLKSGTD